MFGLRVPTGSLFTSLSPIFMYYIIVGHGDNRSLVARAHASYESSVSVLRTMPSAQSSRNAAYLGDIHVTLFTHSYALRTIGLG